LFWSVPPRLHSFNVVEYVNRKWSGRRSFEWGWFTTAYDEAPTILCDQSPLLLGIVDKGGRIGDTYLSVDIDWRFSLSLSMKACTPAAPPMPLTIANATAYRTFISFSCADNFLPVGEGRIIRVAGIGQVI
jgi:hypothetical protein